MREREHKANLEAKGETMGDHAMPTIFTEEEVDGRLGMYELDQSGTDEEKRERLADFVEEKYQDHLEVWEIRTGRSWKEMTSSEAEELVGEKPQLRRNPGVLSRLLGAAG